MPKNNSMKPFLKLMILIAILSVMGTHITIKALKSNPGIDFYQFWGVSLAQKESNGTLKSPYPELFGYAGPGWVWLYKPLTAILCFELLPQLRA
jgi:hypothetical protein